MAVLKDIKKLAGKPGVYYIEHPTRKHGVKKDKKWVIRQTFDKQTRISVLGWLSEGYSEGDALNKAEEYKANHKWNKLHPDQPRKPICMADEYTLISQTNEDFPSVAEFAERFIKYHIKRKLRPATAKEYERQIRKYIIPTWGEHRLFDIKRKQIVKFVEGLSDIAPIQANRVLSTIKKMFSYAIETGVLDTNPTSNIKPPSDENIKDRALTLQEIVILFNTLDMLRKRDIGDILKLIALTAQRPGEIAAMRISQINSKADGVWFELPARQTKSKRKNFAYLSKMSFQIVKSRVNDLKLEDYIFPSSRGGHIRKDVLSKAVNKLQPLLQKQGIERFTAHDLRRTASTRISELGFSSIVDDILNHRNYSGQFFLTSSS
ncbi:MAG: tyrosine-type recombinase/integrase [Anaerolineales bacterium]|nr:tyrosine-type recombinase/integrase [Anaerolineales bacterium]